MTAEALERLRRALRESPAALPGAVAFAIFFVWAVRDGGFDPLRWLQGAIFILLLVVVLVAVAPRPRLGRTLVVGLIAFAAFTAWSYASILWADVRGDAWLGANKTLLYLAVTVLFLYARWTPRAAWWLVSGFAIGVAGLGVVSYIRATTAADPAGWFIEGRLAVPIAYANANCALYLMVFWPLLHLSSRREANPYLRGVALASAGVCAELALMCQSRGSLVALPIVTALYFAIVPGRVRSLVGLGAVGAACFAVGRPILDVYTAVLSGDDLADVLVDARSAILASAAALLVLGCVLGLLDRAVRLGPRGVFAGRVAATAAASLALLAGAFVFVDRFGSPAGKVDDWWESFKSDRYVTAADTPHLISGLGSGRYDLWRVSLETFRANPIAGIGVDNFAVDYLRQRRQLDDPLYPHSLELRMLLQTGVVGAGLALVALGALTLAALRTTRRGPSGARGLAGAALVGFLYWFFHGSVDWFWEIPALAAPALAFVAIACRLGIERPEHDRPLARPAVAAAATVAAVGIASLALPWLSARNVEAATNGWRQDPDRAYDQLQRARALDPLSDHADVIAGVIAAQTGDTDRQQAAFRRALGRNRWNWYPHMELALIDARQGRRESALRRIRVAAHLNPLEPVLLAVRDGIRQGRPPTNDEVERMLVERVADIVGPAS